MMENTKLSEQKTNEKGWRREIQLPPVIAPNGSEHIAQPENPLHKGGVVENSHGNRPPSPPPLRGNVYPKLARPSKRNPGRKHNLSSIFSRRVPATPASTSFGIFQNESKNAMLRYRANKAMVKVGLEKARSQSRTCLGYISSRFILRYDSLFLRFVHVALTFIVFQHFFLVKNQPLSAKFANVTLTEVNQYMNRWIPPVEFGMMHQLLFQMLLIPLTMSKRFLAIISTHSSTRTLFPFSDIVGFHIFLGYWFCWLLFISSALFIFFFAKICYEFEANIQTADNTKCANFQTEIFITGLVCLGVTIIIMVTSYCRNRTPFEVFYLFHMFVFVMFGFAVLHTFDDKARGGKVRSQTIQWVGGSLLIYATSKFWTKFGSTYKCKVLSKEVLDNVIILTLQRPDAFRFEAGQSANLRIPEIDVFAHPFSIASGPKSSKLVFIIEVIKKTSWTGQLASISADKIPFAMVSGPFGNPVANLQDTDAVLAIGTGTGVVPMLSLFERRANHLCNISKYALNLAKMERKTSIKKDSRSHLNKNEVHRNNCISSVQLKYRCRQLNKQGQQSLYFKSLVRAAAGQIIRFLFDFLSWVLALLEICVMGLTLSWGNLPPAAQKQFGEVFMVVLPVCTLILLGGYLLALVFRILNPKIHQHSIWLPIDVLVFLAAAITLVYYWWLDQNSFARPTALQQILRMLFSLWRVGMLMTHRALNTSMRRSKKDKSDVLGTESFKLIWITRNADFVISYVDILMKLIDRAHQALYGRPVPPGWELTLGKFIDFEIFVTDTNDDNCERLKIHMENDSRSEVYSKKVQFGRPDLEVQVVQHKAKKLIENMSGYHEVLPYNTLVTFCGAPVVSRLIFESVLKSNNLSQLLGYPQIHSQFRTQFHGYIAGEASAAPSTSEPEAGDNISPKKTPRHTRAGTQLVDLRVPIATPSRRQRTTISPIRPGKIDMPPGLPTPDPRQSVRSY